MESMKKPEMVLSLTTAASLAGTSIYFYKRLGGLDEKVEKLEEATVSLVEQGGEIVGCKQLVGQMGNTIKAMHGEMARLRDDIQRQQMAEENNQQILNAILKALSSTGITVDIPSMNYRNRPQQEWNPPPIQEPRYPSQPTPYRDPGYPQPAPYREEPRLERPPENHREPGYPSQPAPYHNDPRPYPSQPTPYRGPGYPSQPTPYQEPGYPPQQTPNRTRDPASMLGL